MFSFMRVDVIMGSLHSNKIPKTLDIHNLDLTGMAKAYGVSIQGSLLLGLGHIFF